jgi:hypothetical protein
MFMPSLQDSSAVGPNEPPEQVQLTGVEAVAARKTKRLQPELARTAVTLHVNVRRLTAVEAREEESVWPGNSSDPWHLSFANLCSRNKP